MVDRIVEQRAALDAFFVTKRRDLLLSVEEWEILDELHKLLKPFKEYSKFLSAESSSLSVQVTMAKLLEAELKAYNGEHLKEAVKKMLATHKEKFDGLQLYKYEEHIMDGTSNMYLGTTEWRMPWTRASRTRSW